MKKTKNPAKRPNDDSLKVSAGAKRILEERLAADERDPGGAISLDETMRPVNIEFRRRRGEST